MLLLLSIETSCRSAHLQQTISALPILHNPELLQQVDSARAISILGQNNSMGNRGPAGHSDSIFGINAKPASVWSAQHVEMSRILINPHDDEAMIHWTVPKLAIPAEADITKSR